MDDTRSIKSIDVICVHLFIHFLAIFILDGQQLEIGFLVFLLLSRSSYIAIQSIGTDIQSIDE